MDQSANLNSTMAEKVARAAIAFQKRTGGAPTSVTVILGADTLVITLRGTLSPAEQLLANTEEGAAFLQKSHRRKFTNSYGPLRQQIEKITGVAVREMIAEVEPTSRTMLQVLTTGTIVQVFQLAGHVAADNWSGTEQGETRSP